MFGFPAESSTQAIEMLKADHEKVKDLFDAFEDAKDLREKKRIVQEAINELKVHAAIEEEIFYPAVRKAIDDDAIMNEADEEHHEAKVLIAELEEMTGNESHYVAKFTVLSENVKHHIKEEEDEMLPKAEDTDLDFDALGEKMFKRKQKLLVEGVPPAGEEAMVAASRGRGDSPAKNSQRTVRASKKK